MNAIYHELSIGEVYLPPLLVAGALGLLCASLTARLFNRFGLSGFFCHPPLVFVAMTVLYTVLIGTFIVKV